MQSLSGMGCFPSPLTKAAPPFPPRAPPYPTTPLFKWTPQTFLSTLRASSQPTVTEIAEEDVVQMFLRERELNGDFISKACDMFWQKRVRNFMAGNVNEYGDTSQVIEQVVQSDDDDGFLKLTKTQEWILGNNPAPINQKAAAKALQDDSGRRRKLNILKYEALKKELMLLSVGIGTACTGYCLCTLSVQAAVSYAIGVSFSCLYLQLLYQHADNLSKEMVPQIFMQKKSKKIGIRSEDLQDALEKTIEGSRIALASPRLMIPAAIYGLWILSHHFLAYEIFDFQLMPAMVGMFVYKAASLVQVYRDNEDLQFVFPENDGSSGA